MKEKSVTFATRISESHAQQLVEMADAMGMSVASLIRYAVIRFLGDQAEVNKTDSE